MQTITFKSGAFQNFVAAQKFQLKFAGSDVTLVPGEPLRFDGMNAEINGAMAPCPTLKGALKSGWIVPEGSEQEVVRPVSGNIAFRPTQQTGNSTTPPLRRPAVTTEADEREVLRVSPRSAAVAQNNRDKRAQTFQKGRLVTDENGMEGVEVRSLLTPAKQRTELTATNAGSRIMQAAAPVTEAGRGVSEDEMLARMSPEAASVYREKVDAARQRVAVREGIELEGVRFSTSPKPLNQNPLATSDPKILAARAACPQFPTDYPLLASVRKRVARLVSDFEDDHAVLRAAHAIEDDAGKEALVKEFPDVFPSTGFLVRG